MDATVQCTMCRICMRSDSETMFIEIFKHIMQNQTVDQTLASVVSRVGAVEVQQDDELPEWCCLQCLREVEAAYKLRNLCQESDIKLRSYLSNTAVVVKKEAYSDDELTSQDPEALVSINEVCAQQEVKLLPDVLKQECDDVKQSCYLRMDAAVQCTICRICMRSDSNVMIELFKHIVHTQTLATVVSQVGAVDVQQHDELPEQCCMQCLRMVEAAYKLRNLCQESDVKLRNHLSNTVVVVKKESFSDNELNSQDSEGLVSFNEICAQKEVNFTHDTIKYEYEEITIEETRLIHPNYSESDQCSESRDSVLENADNCFNNHELETNDSENERRRIRLPNSLDKYPAVKFACCGCISSFDTIEELRAHGRQNHYDSNTEIALQKLQCDICFKVLDNRTAYDFHKKNVMYNYRCQICEQILITKKQAYSHHRQHVQTTPTADQALVCCGCKTRFVSADALKIHSETIHLPDKPPADEKKPFTCNICYRNYSLQRTLRKHKISYLKPSKNHHCKECGKSYRYVSELRLHEISHTGTEFPCSQCPKVYFCFESLRTHLVLHSQQHQCRDCKRSFQSKKALDEHSRTHTGERPYLCNECRKSFKTKRACDEHTWVHVTTRHYSCPHCPATFKRKNYLSIHVNIHKHSGQKKYTCPKCNRAFRSKSGKTRHIQAVHAKVKPHVCSFCSKSFSMRHLQIRHEKMMHLKQL